MWGGGFSMRCPKCRTLTLASAGEHRGTGTAWCAARAVRRSWLAPWRRRFGRICAAPPPMTRRGHADHRGRGPCPARSRSCGASSRPRPAGSGLRRYGVAAGAAVLMLALVAVALLAPDVSALPGIALLEGGALMPLVRGRNIRVLYDAPSIAARNAGIAEEIAAAGTGTCSSSRSSRAASSSPPT